MKRTLFSVGIGLLSLASGLAVVGLQPGVAQANNPRLNQLLMQVKANKSWTSASFPVAGFSGYLSLYGQSLAIEGAQVFNRGINLGAKEGSSVRSWLPGRVEQIAYDPTCGNFAVIQSGPWRHKYCALKGQINVTPQGQVYLIDAETILKVGQQLKAGNQLGRIGANQQNQQPQLHWEVQYENQLIDPAIIIGLMHEQQKTAPTVAPRRPPQVAIRPGGPMPSQVLALRQAIIGQESGGNPRAVNPHSGALGYGQVMPENVEPWSREVLGYPLTVPQFLNSPELQLQIIDAKLAQYWQDAMRRSGGNEAIAVRMVASYWYSGDPTLYNNTRPQSYGEGDYPSIAHYTLSILGKYQTLIASRY
ncbi:MAG: peptidoglycan DD-metalloendopeptidase family protein [Leptolyngbyaceae bacterium]|nr:peptidoglycan DD-metalloendopeptidase family protein [Leptolyngbyaceae bacterium]